MVEVFVCLRTYALLTQFENGLGEQHSYCEVFQVEINGGTRAERHNLQVYGPGCLIIYVERIQIVSFSI